MIADLIFYTILISVTFFIIGLFCFVWLNRRDSEFYEQAREERDALIKKELETGHHVVRIQTHLQVEETIEEKDQPKSTQTPNSKSHPT
jgi:hypothetical protein